MKKVALVLVLAVSVFAFSSCSKSCKCTAKFNGETLKEEVITPADGKKCSDYNGSLSILGQTAENKCVPQLF